MKNILKSIGFIIAFIYLTACNHKQRTYHVNNDLSFDCPVKIDSAPDLFKILKSINSNVEYFGVINKNDNRFMLSVSKYSADLPTTMDTAFFEFTAKEVPENNIGDYQILGSGKYVKDNHTYYRKISCNNGTIVNVMFYLMKEKQSKHLFEFKMAGPLDQKDYMIDVLEQTVRSVEFE